MTRRISKKLVKEARTFYKKHSLRVRAANRRIASPAPICPHRSVPPGTGGSPRRLQSHSHSYLPALAIQRFYFWMIIGLDIVAIRLIAQPCGRSNSPLSKSPMLYFRLRVE